MSNQKKKSQAHVPKDKAAPPIFDNNNLITEESQMDSAVGSSNRTFLGVDAILYPKENKNQVFPAHKKVPRKTKFAKNLEVKTDPRLNLDGLKGYGKSAARVSTIMNDMARNNLARVMQE